jgi:large subunit ribosomal protein L10
VRLVEKQNIVKDLQDRFSRSKVVIVTDYKGLDVITLNDLRRALRAAQCEYRVVKNTLLIRASEQSDISLIKDDFKGPNAVALSFDDPVAPARVLTEFAKAHDKLEIKMGVMNGKVLNANAIRALATLPSREVLLAQLLSAVNGASVSFVRALNNIPQRILNVLQAIKEKKEAA